MVRDSIDDSMQQKYKQMMHMQKDRQHVVKALHNKNSTTLQNYLKQQLNYLDSLSPKGQKSHLSPIQNVPPKLPDPQRANMYMPKKPADRWEHEYLDGRLGGF